MKSESVTCEMNAKNNNINLEELGQTLLDIGVHLMSAGANTLRIRKTIERIAASFNTSVELLITHSAINITITNDATTHFYSELKHTLPMGVNFKVISGLSRMSWRVLEENWTIEQINREINRLITLPRYHRLLTLFVVSFACASFCRLFNGNFIDMSVTFLATFAGLFIKQEAHKRNFNPYICVYFSAFTSALIASFIIKYHGAIHEQALSAAVLFLIPGVPLINSFFDLIHGDTMNGLVKNINGLMIAFAITMGVLSALQISHL